MRRRFPLPLFLAAAAFHSVVPNAAAGPARLPWTSSRLQGSPEPAKAYTTEAVFTGLAFEQGLELVAFAGRLYLVERGGRIWSFDE